jgi:hypothetical protein
MRNSRPMKCSQRQTVGVGFIGGEASISGGGQGNLPREAMFSSWSRPLSELENLEVQRDRLIELTEANIVSETVLRQMKATLIAVERRIEKMKSAQRLAA